MSTVLIAPTQGEHTSLFQTTARDILRNIYGSKGAVFKTVLSLVKDKDDPTIVKTKVTFVLDVGKGEFWDNVSSASTFITVSHGGIEDGPNLAYHDSSFPIGTNQPWPTDGNSSRLSVGGMLFWARVGTGRTNTAKIILLGCDSGTTYAGAVSTAAKSRAFGFLDRCAAANSQAMQKVVSDIEKSGKSPGIKSYG
jgi:hypothetical protein